MPGDSNDRDDPAALIYSPLERKLLKAQKVLEVYFMTWGAAKVAMWEDLTNDKPFTAENAMQAVISILSPGRSTNDVREARAAMKE